MKLRMTIVIDKEFTDQQAFERYGAVDPYTVAGSFQTEAQRLADDFRETTGAEIAEVQVVPLG